MRNYCSCPTFIKHKFPKFYAEFNELSGEACHQHDKAYGGYRTHFDDCGNIVHTTGEEIGNTEQVTRFMADTHFFTLAYKGTPKWLLVMIFARIYFLLFGWTVWQKPKILKE
jgi:hypothetical protein